MKQKPTNETSLIRAPIAVVLAWLIPGLGHIYLGYRVRGLILLITITITFWTGVAIGGVKTISDETPPYSEKVMKQLTEDNVKIKSKKSWWFFAQILNGSYAIVTYRIAQREGDYSDSGAPLYLSWPSHDVGSVYTGVAGLLNLLIILDALARAEGLSVVFARSAPAHAARGTRSPPKGGSGRG